MSKYIRSNKLNTNECPNIFVKDKLIRTNVRINICDQYIRIFEYICHTHNFSCTLNNPHYVRYCLLSEVEVVSDDDDEPGSGEMESSGEPATSDPGIYICNQAI